MVNVSDLRWGETDSKPPDLATMKFELAVRIS